MPYTVRFHDVDYGNGGSVRTGVLGSFVTKKIANNAARDHFAGWSDEFPEYDPCDIGDPYHEEYVDGMIDIDAITPEGLAMRAWVERSASTIKKRKPEGSFTHEYIMKSEDTDYRNPRGPGQYDVRSNMQGPFELEEDAINAARNHLRSKNTAEIQVRDYTEEKTPDGMIMICGVAGEVNVRAWIEVREVRVKHSKPASLLPEDCTACPFCGRSAQMFPTGLAGLSRHVRLCPQKVNGRLEVLGNPGMPPATVVVPTHEQPHLPQQPQLTQQLQPQGLHALPPQALPQQYHHHQHIPQMQHLPPQLTHTLPHHLTQTLPQQPPVHHVPSPGADQSLLASNYLMSAAASMAAPPGSILDQHPYTHHHDI
eukprot:TRINITY_DN18586_c0_g1_i2.p1 TRINITY_DN18586_c0_g1~~TRINITY_DN18586_c0_g1_i2.p1  ORF type:complete len:368 (+),score=56.43 TRINITY_DN18586_c0_g1_i2:89-1192(+)